MTPPTFPGSSAPSLTPQSLLSGTHRHSDIVVLHWLAHMKRADLAHPQVRRWLVPLFCAGLAVPALNGSTGDADPGLPVMLALTLGFCVPLLWRQQRPILVFGLTSAAAALTLALDTQSGAEAARLVALLNVGRRLRPVHLAACLVVAIAQTSAEVVFHSGERVVMVAQTPVRVIVESALMVAVATAGLVGRVVEAYVLALREHTEHLQVERDQRARLAVAAERARVAGEMHDILGHTLAVIVGLAGGAAGLTEAKPRRGAETLRIIAESGRGALSELRRLLAVIGDERESADTSPLAPQPSLADLGHLLDRVRAAGPSVGLRTAGDLTALPAGLQLALYRVVQEGLTNTLKHGSPGTTVQVTVSADDIAVHLTVEDTGPARTPAPAGDGGGRGLLGMRERAALYGGNVTAGPNAHGGWTVSATFLTSNSAATEKHPA